MIFISEVTTTNKITGWSVLIELFIYCFVNYTYKLFTKDLYYGLLHLTQKSTCNYSPIVKHPVTRRRKAELKQLSPLLGGGRDFSSSRLRNSFFFEEGWDLNLLRETIRVVTFVVRITTEETCTACGYLFQLLQTFNQIECLDEIVHAMASVRR